MAASILEYLVAFIQSAGAPTEAATDRDGFASYKSETHAIGMGLAAGWFLGATGDTRLVSVVYGAAVYGRRFGESGQRRRLMSDIVEEPHYALGGVVVGWVVARGVGFL